MIVKDAPADGQADQSQAKQHGSSHGGDRLAGLHRFFRHHRHIRHAQQSAVTELARQRRLAAARLDFFIEVAVHAHLIPQQVQLHVVTAHVHRHPACFFELATVVGELALLGIHLSLDHPAHRSDPPRVAE